MLVAGIRADLHLYRAWGIHCFKPCEFLEVEFPSKVSRLGTRGVYTFRNGDGSNPCTVGEHQIGGNKCASPKTYGILTYMHPNTDDESICQAVLDVYWNSLDTHVTHVFNLYAQILIHPLFTNAFHWMQVNWGHCDVLMNLTLWFSSCLYIYISAYML